MDTHPIAFMKLSTTKLIRWGKKLRMAGQSAAFGCSALAIKTDVGAILERNLDRPDLPHEIQTRVIEPQTQTVQLHFGKEWSAFKFTAKYVQFNPFV